MPFLILIIFALTAGTVVGVTIWRYPQRRTVSTAPSLDAAEKIGEVVERRPGLRHLMRDKLNPESATGLALLVALLFTVGAGIVLGLLAYLVRTNSRLINFDNGIAKWGNRHASPLSTHALNWVTQLGSVYVVIGLAVILAAAETVRTRSYWVIPFVVAVIGGEELISNVIKGVVDRTRPTFNPAAATLGPSFPSGHTTTAAAFYAAAALLLGRWRPRLTRAVLAGAAVGIAVAVAASRVLLDVHWLTDVLGGLALGWAWFAVCGVAFGGRILYFGAAAEVATQVAEPDTPPRVRPPSPASPR